MNLLGKSGLLVVAALAIVLTTANAETPALKVGDPAPRLVSGKYIQGDPVTNFEAGKTYIVEFWATWCPPCRATIPHLTEIQAKYKEKGLVVIGQDCSERDESEVAPFVKAMGDKMTYRVALDDRTTTPEGAMIKTWMEASGRSGIPSAFIVSTNGVIAWIGYATELVTKQDLIEQVLDGKYDIKKAAADYADDLKADDDMAKVNDQLQMKMGAVAQAMRSEKWDEAATNLDEAEKIIPLGARKKVNFDLPRWRILQGKKDYAAADTLAAKIADSHGNDPGLMTVMARQISNEKDNPKPNLELAGKLIELANKATDGKNPDILDTQARILFMKGQKDTAITIESKAIAATDDQQEKSALQKNLDSYKSDKLPARD